MTDTIITQTESVLVAIDISKARHEVLIAVPGKKRRRRLSVLNPLDDFTRADPNAIVFQCNRQLPSGALFFGLWRMGLAIELLPLAKW